MCVYIWRAACGYKDYAAMPPTCVHMRQCRASMRKCCASLNVEMPCRCVYTIGYLRLTIQFHSLVQSISR